MFKTPSPPTRKSYEAEILRESSPTHMSYVPCHGLHVIFHMSHDKKGQSGGASQ